MYCNSEERRITIFRLGRSGSSTLQFTVNLQVVIAVVTVIYQVLLLLLLLSLLLLLLFLLLLLN